MLTGFRGLFGSLGLFDLGLEMVFIVGAAEEDIERVGEGVGIGGERAHAGLVRRVTTRRASQRETLGFGRVHCS